MKISKEYRVPLAAGLCLLLLVATLLSLTYQERGNMRRARDAFHARYAVLLNAYDRPWLPSEAAVEFLKSKIAKSEDLLKVLEDSVLGEIKKQFSPSPRRSADMVFHLQAMVDRLRRRAQEMGVELTKEDEGFGFEQLLRDGVPPSPSALIRLDRERQLIEFLSNALFASRPHQLLKIEREALDTGGPVKTCDTFTPDGADWRALQALSYSIVPIRFTFEGNTEHLRSFVNAVTLADWPLVILDVAASPTKMRGRPQQEGAFDPMIAPAPVNFRVTLAWVGGLK